MFAIDLYFHLIDFMESVRALDFLNAIKEISVSFFIAGFFILAQFSQDWSDDDPESFP